MLNQLEEQNNLKYFFLVFFTPLLLIYKIYGFKSM